MKEKKRTDPWWPTAQEPKITDDQRRQLPAKTALSIQDAQIVEEENWRLAQKWAAVERTDQPESWKDDRRTSISDSYAYILPTVGRLLITGARFSTTQSKKGSGPRGRIYDDYDSFSEGQTMNELVTELACSGKDELGDKLPHKDLWVMFYGKLDDFGLDPKEEWNVGDNNKSYILYDLGDRGRKQITFGTFKNVVGKARKRSKARR